MKLILVIPLLSFLSCTNSRPHANKQTLDFGEFTIETPIGWKKIKEQGIDSYVGRIALDNTDTISFDLGWYSNKLNETEPWIIERSELKNMDIADTSTYVVVEHKPRVDPDKYKKNNVSWATIDGRNAKIVFPRRSGIGTTGVYIDSLWQEGADVDRFNLYGINLKPLNEKLLLDAIKTLRFHKGK